MKYLILKDTEGEMTNPNAEYVTMFGNRESETVAVFDRVPEFQLRFTLDTSQLQYMEGSFNFYEVLPNKNSNGEYYQVTEIELPIQSEYVFEDGLDYGFRFINPTTRMPSDEGPEYNQLTNPYWGVTGYYEGKYQMYFSSIEFGSNYDMSDVNTDFMLAYVRLQGGSITLPETLRVVGESMFASTEFNDIVLQEGVTTIKDYAFINCGAQRVFIPSTVEHIGNRIFENSHFSEIVYNGTIDQFNRIFTGGTLMGDYDYIEKVTCTDGTKLL